jgi:hypothetical protein
MNTTETSPDTAPIIEPSIDDVTPFVWCPIAELPTVERDVARGHKRLKRAKVAINIAIDVSKHRDAKRLMSKLQHNYLCKLAVIDIWNKRRPVKRRLNIRQYPAVARHVRMRRTPNETVRVVEVETPGKKARTTHDFGAVNRTQHEFLRMAAEPRDANRIEFNA